MLLAIPLGVAVGIAVGMLGGGGSVLAVPVLVYILGEPVDSATTISLVAVTAAAIAGGYGHARDGRVCWRHAAIFSGAALPGIVAGTALGNIVGGRALIAGFALVMLVAAAATWRKASSGDTIGDEASSPGHRCPALDLRRDIAAGLVVGFLTGLFGVGGGFVIVPTLALALAFSMRSAIGTSLAIITATSVLAVVVHLTAGRSLDPGLAAVMAASCAGGALLGARLSVRVPQRTLGRAFAALVVAVAGYLLASAAFLGGPPGSS